MMCGETIAVTFFDSFELIKLIELIPPTTADDHIHAHIVPCNECVDLSLHYYVYIVAVDVEPQLLRQL